MYHDRSINIVVIDVITDQCSGQITRFVFFFFFLGVCLLNLQLRHPHIICIFDVFLTKQHLAIVMEYAEMGDLKTYVMQRRGLNEDEARWFFQQIILALDFAFKMGIVNRDIKLDNLMLTSSGRSKSSPLVKLGDFGLSKDILTSQQSAAKSRVGTVMYMAPEIIAGGTGEVYDAIRSDLWSCGVVLFTMMTGSYPFDRPSDASLSDSQAVRAALRRILDGDYLIPEDKKVSDSARNMLEGLLNPDPSKRISISEIMEHAFFKTNLSTAILEYNDSLMGMVNIHQVSPDEKSMKDTDLVRIKKIMRQIMRRSLEPV